jgi:hypothetical protein
MMVVMMMMMMMIMIIITLFTQNIKCNTQIDNDNEGKRTTKMSFVPFYRHILRFSFSLSFILSVSFITPFVSQFPVLFVTTGWTVPGSDTGGSQVPHPFTPTQKPTQLPIQWATCLLSEVKRRRVALTSYPASGTEVKERVELYFYFSYAPSSPTLGYNFISLLFFFYFASHHVIRSTI